MNVHEAIRTRRSVREYADRPIPPESLAKLKDALRFAPSACNYQPWRFVLVFDPERRRQIAQVANQKMWIAQAPLIVAACGLPAKAYPRMAGKHNSVDIDVAIALDHLTLAAVAEGLATCWIGAFDEDQIKPILAVPQDVRVIALAPVGYPASGGLNRPITDAERKPQREIFTVDRW